MRILVFSDSHGRAKDMFNVLSEHPEAEYVLHLGDGNREFEGLMPSFPDKKFIMVCGNNDMLSTAPYSELVKVDNILIYMAHGHRHSVHDTLYYLRRDALEVGAKIVLYGHTHVAHSEYMDGIYVMNPGSISRPRLGVRSYGFIDIDNKNIFCGVSEV